MPAWPPVSLAGRTPSAARCNNKGNAQHAWRSQVVSTSIAESPSSQPAASAYQRSGFQLAWHLQAMGQRPTSAANTDKHQHTQRPGACVCACVCVCVRVYPTHLCRLHIDEEEARYGVQEQKKMKVERERRVPRSKPASSRRSIAAYRLSLSLPHLNEPYPHRGGCSWPSRLVTVAEIFLAI